MAVSVSLVLLTGLILAILLRANKGYGTAFVAVLFGFYLASSGAAGAVNKLTAAVISAIPNL
jgi:preprotein translocase subunit SecG